MTVVGGSTDHLIVNRKGDVRPDAVLEVQTVGGIPVTDLTAPSGWTGLPFPSGKARADGDGYFKFIVPDATGPVQVRTAAHTEGTEEFAAGPWLTPSGQIVPDSALEQALAAMATDADIDAAVAAQAATDSATFALKGVEGGKGVSRVLTKLLTEQDVTIAYVGDSGLEGNTATAGLDAASRVKDILDARFGASTIKANRAVSGYTTYWAMCPGVASPTKFSQALADKADLYVIAFGHNDIKSVVASPYLPGIGYDLAGSLSALEHMVRRIRIDVPSADIIISNQWPYTSTAIGSNGSLSLHAQAMRRLAAAYGCGWVDYWGALTALGVTGTTPAVDDVYIWPTGSGFAQHPTDEGHRVWAEQITNLLPLDVTPSPEAPTLPRPLYGAERYTHAGWAAMPVEAAATRVNGADGYTLTGSWAGTATLPQTSTTVGDKIDVLFIGSEVALRIDVGTTGHIKIEVNGSLYNADLDLAALGSLQARLPLNLGPGVHRVVVTVLSGTVTFRGVEYLPSLGTRTPYTSGLVTYTGTWTAGGTDAKMYEGNSKFTNVMGDSVTVEWVGTALWLSGYRYGNTTWSIGVATDGGTEVVTDQASGTGATTQPAGWLVTSGLPYGRHTTTIRLAQTGRALFVSTFLAYDETRTERPGRLAGMTVSGEVVTMPVALPGRPTVRLTPAGSTSTLPPYATGDSTAGFTANGTAAAKLGYEVETSRVAY